ncbi:MAG: alpha/beta hydrolase [Taibaiella sp.]|jgi:pimeloyl-ACP methyl ester carboxylesterase
MATTTYFIGGIATDIHLYDYPLKKIPNAVYLPFPQHDKGDNIATYARKFIPLIDTANPFNIVANSMGGIITMELVKNIHPEKIILISSVKCREEMPWRLRQLRYSSLHKLLPGKGFIAGVQYGSRFIKEINKTPGVRKTVIQMAKNNPPDFLYWCVNAIVKWNGKRDYRKDIIHIHGTKDAMFPYRNIRNAVPIINGTHNMLLTRKEEITALLIQHLNNP